MNNSARPEGFNPMMRLLAILIATAFLGLVPEAPAEAKTFKSCADLRQTYKNGVSLNKSAANRGAGPILKPAVNAAVYRLNKRLDTDRDNIACEVLRPRPRPVASAAPTTTPRPTPTAAPTAEPAPTVPAPAPTAEPAPSPSAPAGPVTITSEEVARNNTRESCWVIISGSVYNLTEWIRLHPGGAGNILNLCGRDGTNAFAGMHGGQARPQSVLQGYYLAELRR